MTYCYQQVKDISVLSTFASKYFLHQGRKEEPALWNKASYIPA